MHHQEDIGLIYVVVIWIQNLNVCKRTQKANIWADVFQVGLKLKTWPHVDYLKCDVASLAHAPAYFLVNTNQL